MLAPSGDQSGAAYFPPATFVRSVPSGRIVQIPSIPGHSGMLVRTNAIRSPERRPRGAANLFFREGASRIGNRLPGDQRRQRPRRDVQERHLRQPAQLPSRLRVIEHDRRAVRGPAHVARRPVRRWTLRNERRDRVVVEREQPEALVTAGERPERMVPARRGVERERLAVGRKAERETVERRVPIPRGRGRPVGIQMLREPASSGLIVLIVWSPWEPRPWNAIRPFVPGCARGPSRSEPQHRDGRRAHARTARRDRLWRRVPTSLRCNRS